MNWPPSLSVRHGRLSRLIWAAILVTTLTACGSTTASPAATTEPTKNPTPMPSIGPRIVGTVLAPDGSPVAGVSVFANKADEPTQSWSAASGRDGRYSLTLPGPGDWIVGFDDNLDRFPMVWAGKPGPVRDGAAAVAIRVGGDETEYDVTLPPGFRLGGRLVSERGPLQGFRLLVCSTEYGVACAEGTTGADGVWSIGGLAGGYSVEFQEPDGEGSFWWSEAGPADEASGHVELTADRIDLDLSITSDRLDLRGRSVAGTFVDRQGNPINGATVTLFADGTAGRGTVAAPDGSWRIGGVEPGTYTIQAYSPIESGFYTPDGLAPTGSPVVVSGADLADLALRPAALPPGGLWERLPVELAGVPLHVRYVPSGWAANLPPETGTVRIALLLDLTAAQIGDGAQVADGPASLGLETVAITATAYPGAGAGAILDAWRTWGAESCADCTLNDETIGGRRVISNAGPGRPPSLLAYAVDGVLFEVVTEDHALAEAAIAALP